jgi:16S rRNA G1207 methylase RsmC
LVFIQFSKTTTYLADINPEAVEACRLTATQNGLAERVTVYHSDNLDGIPASSSGTWLSATRRISSMFHRAD